MPRSIPIWIADSPNYTQGQEGWVDGDAAPDAEPTRRQDRGLADGGKQPGQVSRYAGRGTGLDAGRDAGPDTSDAMRALRQQIEEIGRPKDMPARVVLGEEGRGIALRFGAVHEWFQFDARAMNPAGTQPQTNPQPIKPCKPVKRGQGSGRAHHWTPPLTLLAAVACEAMRHGGATRLVWIGRRVFPYPVFLARQHPSWLAASLFVDVRERDARVWAIDVALRSGVPACVIADGHGITLAESRRLQVAAKCGNGVALLARPAHEASELSAAATRWIATPELTGIAREMRTPGDVRAAHASDGSSETDSYARVAWRLTLVRSKGESLGMDAGSLIAEWRDAQGLVVVPAMVASRAGRKAIDAAS